LNSLLKNIRAVFAGMLFLLAGSVFALPVYVGSFNVFDGPSWTIAPQPLSAREVAAMLYGGVYSDYAISVSESQDPNSITHSAWLDGVLDTQYLETPATEDFVGIPPSGLYDDYPAYSAWVCDHADCVADGYESSEGWFGFNYTNYVWRLNAVIDPTPITEPNPALLMTTALLLLLTGGWLRGKKNYE
jgi:hypothetical protein